MKTILIAPALCLFLGLGGGCSSHRKPERGAAVGAATMPVIGSPSGNPRTGEVGGGTSSNRTEGSAPMHDSSEYYMSLMSPSEVDTLRARARSSGHDQYPLTDFLTAEEKANLRRRDAARRSEIGR